MTLTITPSFSALSPIALAAGEDRLLQFINQQIADIDAESEIAPGFWALFAHENDDDEAGVLSDALLETAPFPFKVGPSGDGAWRIYYIATPTKATAHHWLEDIRNVLSGKIRKISPVHRETLDTLLESPMAHRIARQIATVFEAGSFPLAGIRDPQLVRSLLDRIHMREPLYLAALQTLMDCHLIDLLVLHQQLIDEDLEVCNDLTQGSVSQDPFFKSRQESVSAIRDHLIQGKIINPMDQRKHSEVVNPYAAIVDLRAPGTHVLIRIDGIEQEIPREDFIASIRAIRSRIYLGESVSGMGTNAPWVTASNAYPLRFVQQRLVARPGTSALLWLYMLERAVAM